MFEPYGFREGVLIGTISQSIGRSSIGEAR